MDKINKDETTSIIKLIQIGHNTHNQGHVILCVNLRTINSIDNKQPNEKTPVISYLSSISYLRKHVFLRNQKIFLHP